MSQEKLKDFQKQLFEYDYTLKKIDTILMSAKLSQDDREQYQFSREACQKIKAKCSQEMSDYARKNRLSLLLPPLSREEKEELTRSIEEKPKPGEPSINIRLDNLRNGTDFASEVEEEEPPQVEEKTSLYTTRHLPKEEIYNVDVESEDVESEDVESEDVESEDSDIYSYEEIEFIKELKKGVALFYGV